MKTVSLTIDGKEITANEGKSLLWVALENGIYIPNLCALPDAQEPAAGCRLCFVEIAGRDEPMTACTETAAEGMVVSTRGPKALWLARSGFELLMASHQLECAHCIRNGSCELQRIAHHLGMKLKSKRLRKLLKELPLDTSLPFAYDPNRCVLCGRCVWVCRERLGVGVLGFAYRGFDRVVTTFPRQPSVESKCRECGECVAVCPTSALALRNAAGER